MNLVVYQTTFPALRYGFRVVATQTALVCISVLQSETKRAESGKSICVEEEMRER